MGRIPVPKSISNSHTGIKKGCNKYDTPRLSEAHTLRSSMQVSISKSFRF